jgi:DMSO reductase family type II enzyme chaperone
MMKGLSQIYMVYARLFDFPTPQVAKAAQDGSIGSSLAGMHAQAGIPAPPPMRTNLEPAGLEQTFISTFDVGIPEPPAPLYESTYSSPGRSRDVLEEILRFYEFFDVKPATEGRERPDHLTLELEFMAALVHMEWLARERGARPDAFLLAQRDFLLRHLLPLLNSLKSRTIPDPFYQGLIEGLFIFITAHLENLPKR